MFYYSHLVRCTYWMATQYERLAQWECMRPVVYITHARNNNRHSTYCCVLCTHCSIFGFVYALFLIMLTHSRQEVSLQNFTAFEYIRAHMRVRLERWLFVRIIIHGRIAVVPKSDVWHIPVLCETIHRSMSGACAWAPSTTFMEWNVQVKWHDCFPSSLFHVHFFGQTHHYHANKNNTPYSIYAGDNNK